MTSIAHTDQDTATTVADTPTGADADQRIRDAQFEYAFALIRHVNRSATDPLYRQAFLEAYAEVVSADLVPALNAAIDEIIENAAAEAELVGVAILRPEAGAR